jgi:flagellar hook-basal body complex protein FliE
MDATQINQLDDEAYEKLTLSNTYPPARDTEVWEALTHPNNLERTRQVVETAWQRTGNVLRTRKEERDAFQNECFERGPEGKKEWYASRTEYEAWRRRAVNFHQNIQRALGEVRKAQKSANRATNFNVTHKQRQSLRELTLAVNRHQAAHARAGGIAEQADYELWALLDQLTVPCGHDEEQVTLRTMLDIYWTDVTPTTEIEQRRTEAERAMRSAPSGQSSRYAGTPRARHVHNDKKLA